jgi:hypothetical protein
MKSLIEERLYSEVCVEIDWIKVSALWLTGVSGSDY